MQIQFTENGESPDMGIFTIGDIKLVQDDIAQAMLKRGIAKEMKIKKDKKEVQDNGRD